MEENIKKTVVEKVKEFFTPETKDETLVETEVIEAAEEVVTEEITIEAIAEQLTSIAETVANIDTRLQKLEGDEAPEEEVEPTDEEMSSDEVQNFGTIAQVHKWKITVDQDSFEVGTELTGTYEDGTTWRVDSGEYELDNGDKIQVDVDGKIVLITGKDAPEAPEETEETEETEAPAKDEMSAVVEDEAITALKLEVEELKSQLTELAESDATEAILNAETQDSKNPGNVKLKAQIERQRKAQGRK